MATEANGDAATEGTGLVFHPMDQFIVKPLFQTSEEISSFDVDRGVGILEGGREVALSSEQLAHAVGGEHVEINLFDAGLQQVGMFTVTNVTLWMGITVLAIFALLVLGTSKRAVIPSRTQSVGELAYGFIYKMIEDVAGKDGIKYFPYIMTLFMFIVFSNFLGLLPMAFTTTSHIAVTGGLAVAVFLSVTVIGFYKHGFGFLNIFWIAQAPLILRPILALIEVISYFVRPLSHSIRLAGNMMAGHAVIKVFAAFAAVLAISPFSIIAITAMYALEVLVAFIQAYVFAILTCVYLKDALHPHH